MGISFLTGGESKSTTSLTQVDRRVAASGGATTTGDVSTDDDIRINKSSGVDVFVQRVDSEVLKSVARDAFDFAAGQANLAASIRDARENDVAQADFLQADITKADVAGAGGFLPLLVIGGIAAAIALRK